MWFYIFKSHHYQKIDKYKQKYRGNIFVDKFSRDFTNENIPSVYTEGITVGKKLKQSKKNNDVSFLPMELLAIKSVGKLWTLFTMSITKGITDGKFRRYFSENSRIVHFPIALLIVVLYGQNHRQIEKLSMLFGGFLKKFN